MCTQWRAAIRYSEVVQCCLRTAMARCNSRQLVAHVRSPASLSVSGQRRTSHEKSSFLRALCVSYHRPWGLDIFSKYASWRWPIALRGLLSWAVSLLIILECQSLIYSKNAVGLEQLDLHCIEHAIRQCMNCLLTSFIASFQLYWSENYESPYLLWSVAASDWKLVLHVHVPYVRTVLTEMSSLDLKWLRELWMGRRWFCSFPLSWSGRLYRWQLDCRSSAGGRCCKVLWLL